MSKRTRSVTEVKYWNP